MPRYDKQPINNVSAPDSPAPRVALGVAANPVDLTVRRQGGEGALALASALSSLVPALASYGASKREVGRRERTLAGAKARDEQPTNDVLPTLREQDPDFQAGYMRQHGLRMAVIDGEETRRLYDEQKDLPGFNPDKFFAERRAAGLKGMTDADAYEGYARELFNTEATLRRDFGKDSLEKTRDQQFSDRQAEIASLQREAKTWDAPRSIGAYNAFVTKHAALGVPRSKLTAEWMSAILADPDAVPQDFDYLLHEPDASGTVPANHKAPNGKAYREAILAAQEKAQEREDKKYSKQMSDAQRQGIIDFGKTLREDPMSIGDPVEYVRQRSHIWPTGPAAEGAIADALKQQAEWKLNQQYQAYLNGTAWAPAGLAGSDPRFKKAVDQRHMEIWSTVDPMNPDSIAGAVNASTELFQRTHVPSPFIESLSKRVAGMSLLRDQKGAEALPPEFHLAYGIYKSLRDSNNENLALFNDDARAFLTAFEDAPGTDVERFQAAKIATDPKTKERIRRQAWDAPEQRTAAVRAEETKLGSWLHERVGLMSSPANAREVAERTVSYAELLRSRGGNMTMDQALKIALEKMAATHAWDGHGSLARIPQDLPKAKATEYLSNYIGDALRQRPEIAGNYVVETVQVGNKPGFALRTPLGVDILPPRTFEELDRQVLQSKGATIDQTEARQHRMADERRDYYLRQLELGQLSPEEYGRSIMALDAADDREHKAQAREVAKAINGAPRLPKADMMDPSIRIPVPAPIGPEVSPRDLGLTRAKSDPYTALMAVGEGFHNVLFDDPNQRDKLIGFGYNVSVRKEEQVRKDFARAGIVDPERQTRVLEGKEAITPDEAAALANLVKDKSAKIAIDVVGQKVWDALPDNRRAVLIDLAYQSGDSSSAFRSALGNLAKGNEKGVKAALEVSYWASKDQKYIKDHRRNNLRLAMWESPDKFQALVNRGT